MVELYIPNLNNDKRFSSAFDANAPLPDDYSELKELQSDLLNRTKHLERSNEELMDADPNRTDIDFQLAIGENIEILEKYKKKVEAIKNKLLELESRTCLGSRQAAAQESTQLSDSRNSLPMDDAPKRSGIDL